MQVELFKKKGTYLQDGQDKYFTRFYLKCGDSLIPVEPTYFSRKNDSIGRRFNFLITKKQKIIAWERIV